MQWPIRQGRENRAADQTGERDWSGTGEESKANLWPSLP